MVGTISHRSWPECFPSCLNLPRFRVTGSNEIENDRFSAQKRHDFDYDLRTDPVLASDVIYTLLARCDWNILFDGINRGRHAALYYQLEFAIDCLKRDVPIPDDWLVY